MNSAWALPLLSAVISTLFAALVVLRVLVDRLP